MELIYLSVRNGQFDNGSGIFLYDNLLFSLFFTTIIFFKIDLKQFFWKGTLE